MATKKALSRNYFFASDDESAFNERHFACAENESAFTANYQRRVVPIAHDFEHDRPRVHYCSRNKARTSHVNAHRF
jgi:hypothetical protein